MSTVKDYQPSGDSQRIVDDFLKSDNAYKDTYAEFADRYATEIAQLEQLREDRNVKLDAAGKILRDEATRLDPKRYKTFRVGPFQVSKKFTSDSYRAVEAVKLAKSLGVLKPMEDEGAIATKIEINFEAMKEFLKKNSLTDKFATTLEGGTEMTPSITGPKPIPAFGTEVKGSK